MHNEPQPDSPMGTGKHMDTELTVPAKTQCTCERECKMHIKQSHSAPVLLEACIWINPGQGGQEPLSLRATMGLRATKSPNHRRLHDST